MQGSEDTALGASGAWCFAAGLVAVALAGVGSGLASIAAAGSGLAWITCGLGLISVAAGLGVVAGCLWVFRVLPPVFVTAAGASRASQKTL